MAQVFQTYTHALKILAGAGDWAADTQKLALVTSAYTLDLGHQNWSQASPFEVSSGNGYTTGGEPLANKNLSDIALTADNVEWTNLTKTFRAGILYIEGTVDGVIDPLLGHLLFDDTGGGQDIVVTGNNFIVTWNVVGVFTLSVV